MLYAEETNKKKKTLRASILPNPNIKRDTQAKDGDNKIMMRQQSLHSSQAIFYNVEARESEPQPTNHSYVITLIS